MVLNEFEPERNVEEVETWHSEVVAVAVTSKTTQSFSGKHFFVDIFDDLRSHKYDSDY